jgi:hypothetical protein
MDGILAIVGVLALGVAGLYALIAWEKKAANTWEVVAEGELDRCEQRRHHYARRSGAMVHTTHHYTATITVVHFTDGNHVACWGHADPGWPKGTRVRVLKNGLGRHRLENLGGTA